MTGANSWTAQYSALIARLPELVAAARLTLGGFSVFTDVYLSLHATFDELDIAAGDKGPARHMVNELSRRAINGIGGELVIEWEDGPTWIDRLVSGRRAVGGTNLQAAHMLATLGAPAMAALEDRSAGQLAVIHPDVLIATAEGPKRCAEITPSGKGRPPHYIFEYTAGERIGGKTIPRSSRFILGFDHRELERDPLFDCVSITLASTAGAGIICGFNEARPDKVRAEVEYARRSVRAWRLAGLELVHFELGDYASAADRDFTIKEMAPEVTSLGMSLSELRGISPNAPAPDLAAVELAEALGLRRVCVHADEWALAVTCDDPRQELLALQTGCLLAATRAAAGDFAIPRRLPDNVRFAEPAIPISRRLGRWSVVCCPAPYLERPKATIGLGDTFLAGTLLVLGGSTTRVAQFPKMEI